MTSPGLSPLSSLVLAALLAAVGCGRFTTDVLTDARPQWSAALEGTVWRYLARAPSDGTLVGDLNVQWFKILAIPTLVSGLYVVTRIVSRNHRESARRWQSASYRGLYLSLFFVMCTVMEIEKATHVFQFRMAGLLAGETPWLNHAAHLISLGLGLVLMQSYSFPAPPRKRP